MNQDEKNHFDEPREHGDVPGNAGDAEPNEAQVPGDEGAGDRVDTGHELARMKEAMLRLKADMDNREKRLEREMAKTRKFALEALMRDLIQVLDSMDQALSSADADKAPDAFEGMELVRKQALQVLSSHGLEMLDPQGEEFDPSWHEAMATQPSDEHESGTVFRVLQKGYRLNDRLIRPARVIVASND